MSAKARGTGGFRVEAIAGVLVLPVRGNAAIRDGVHVGRADLQFDPAIARPQEGGVDRPVPVGLGHGDVVLEPVGQRPPLLVRGADRAVAVLDRVDDQAKCKDIAEIVERDRLGLQLAPDRVGALQSARQLSPDPAARHDQLDVRTNALQATVVVRDQLFEAAGDGGVGFRLQFLEGQVFQLTGIARQPDAARERRIDLQRLPGNPRTTFRLGHEADGAHVVKAVGELHEQHANVPRGGQDEFLEVLGLEMAASIGRQARELGDAIDQFRDRPAKLVFDFGNRGVRVLHDIVEQARNDGGLIELELGQQSCDCDGMGVVRISGVPELLAVLQGGVDICPVESLLVRIGLIRPHAVDKLILAQKPPASGAAGLGAGRCPWRSRRSGPPHGFRCGQKRSSRAVSRST
jgi:hypothetical protein